MMIEKKNHFIYKNNKYKIFLSPNKPLFYLKEAYTFLFIPWCLLEAKWL